MQAAFYSTIPELRSFGNKLCQDQAAVQAGLTLKWKNGMVEGHKSLKISQAQHIWAGQF
jgi:transposase